MWQNIQQISVFNCKQKYQSNYIYYHKATAKTWTITKF